MAPPILVDGLRKSYGAQLALGGVSFEVAAGEIVGLLGPNGAGKSTTLGVLATLLRFDAGRVAVAGHALPAGAGRARRALGLVPQQVAVYPTLGARENLCFFARALGLGRREGAQRAAAALDLVGLGARADEPAARLSGGMRRRLNLACGVLHAPAVLLLDEPVVGVDPQSRERIFEAIETLARGGAAVLYSTHQMEEAERLCARVVLLDTGRVVAAGTPAALVAGAGLTAVLRLRTARPLPAGWLAGIAGATLAGSSASETTVRVTDTGTVPAILAAALRTGGDVLAMTLVRPSLADAFFALTGRALRDEDAAAAASA
ncbi:MAG TPA: ABC transporter ATP-binding protein [Verrucomicrobiae bacterium]|nr:ABC transporter ATP-binding protein [Verrucomicrobiae bacterium]